MIIKKVELKNWGPHKSLEFDSDNHIVGIIGSNGKGKSNLLQAIAYALTGDLDKTKGTAYIRNFGSPDAAKEAFVKITFKKGAEEGTIIRKIKDTGTTSRQMTWGGKTLKSAAEVEKLMTELLGADKEAMKNAVYIKQGDIAKLVKGTPTERQEINLKLMNLNFTEQRTEKIRQYKAVLSNGLIDYLQVEALLQEQESSMKVNLESYKSRINKLKESSDIYSWLCYAYPIISTKVVDARNIDSTKAHLLDLNSKIKEILYANNVTSVEEFNTLLKSKREEGINLQNALSLKRSYETCCKEQKELHKIISSTEEEINELADKLKNDAIGNTEKIIAERTALISTITRYRTLKENKQKYLNDLTTLNGKLKSVEAPDSPINVLKQLKDSHTEELIKLTSQQVVSMMADSAICPICSGTLTEEHKQKCKSDVATLSSKIEKIKAKIEDVNTHIEIRERERVELISKINDTMNLLRTCLAEIETIRNAENGELVAKAQDSDFINFKDELAMYESSLVDLKSDKKKYDYLQGVLAGHNTRFITLTKECADLVLTSKKLNVNLNKDLTKLETQYENFDKLKTKLEDVNIKLKELQSYINSESNLLVSFQNNYNSYVNSLNTLQEKYPHISLDTTTESLDPIIDSYKDQAMEYASLDRLIKQTETELAELRHKLKECRDNIETNNKKLQLIEDLQAVINVTCKNGVPLAYANEVFAKITPMVQEMLERMQANFTVAIDPERPMTYKFTRTDNDSGYAMPQERLSGGQAIRLAIALLIACQQTILPEVGLLILDEPSSHIDSEGVEHMRDMFIQLEDILKNSNMQVILVDHNPTLVAAFDKTIKL